MSRRCWPFVLLLAVSLASPAWLRAQSRALDTVSNLKQIGLWLAMYADDHDGRLPSMESTKAVMKALVDAGLAKEEIFRDPGTGKFFQPNAAMSHQQWQGDPDAVLFFEAVTAPDGTRAVLFNDGHVARMHAGTWEEFRRQFKITAAATDPADAGLENLRLLGAALTEYAKDGDKTLPPLDDLAAAKRALLPYTGMKDVFTQPGTGEPYRVNVSLSRTKLSAIPKPGQVVVFYQSTTTNDTRAVLFLDGRVERIRETQWPDLKKASNIP